jgi:Flp pilus assembly protein TadG
MRDNQLRGTLRTAAGFKGQRGQAVVMVSIGVLFLMGILGLVIDVGWGYYRKQVAQAAADATVTAAVTSAGTGSITCGSGGVICPSSKACSDASITGSSNNINNGCLYGVYDGVAASNMIISAGTDPVKYGVAVKYWVTANVAEPLLPTFLRTMGFTSATVGAQATGAVVSTGGGTGGGCLYVMDSSAGAALSISGAAIASTCGIYLNSNNISNAFVVQGNGTLTGSGAGTFTMVTGAKISDSGSGCKHDAFYTLSGSSTQCVDPTYAAAAADPLASVPAPSYSGCDHTNYSWSNLTPPQTLSQGVYCGGINIGGGNVTFNPGTYVLNGGGLRIQGGSNTTVTGAGVFFYNTSSGYTAGSLLMSSQTNVDFKAPTSGPYQGIMFMQDHSVCPSTSHAINGAPTPNNLKINGTIYTHCTQTGGSYVPQTMLYTGQSTAGYYMALVVDKLTVNGATNLVLDPTGGSNTGIGLGGGNKPFLIQ